MKLTRCANRRGNIVILTTVLLVVLFAMVAFAIDIALSFKPEPRCSARPTRALWLRHPICRTSLKRRSLPRLGRPTITVAWEQTSARPIWSSATGPRRRNLHHGERE